MYGSHAKANGSSGNPLFEGDERHYFKKMKDILEDFPNKGPPSVPSQLLPHLYIGSLRNAEDVISLERMGITHVLNVAGTRKFDLTKSPYPKDLGIKEYLMIPAEDYDQYNITQHFFESNAFINRAKRIGGKALVHCNLGVNRCAAICAAYLLIEERLPLLEVISFMKRKRAVVLCNKGFRLQILRYAMARGLIESVDNGNKYGTLGTISKYLVNRPVGRIEVEKQKARVRESETQRIKEQESLKEIDKTKDNNKATNGQMVKATIGNSVSNGAMNGDHSDETDGNGNGQKNDADDGEIKENGHTAQENGTVMNGAEAVNGDVSDEDEEVASLVSHPPRVSRFLPRNSTIYSPEPSEDEPSSYKSNRPYKKAYTRDLGKSYSPTTEFGTYFGTKPYRRSYSADIESLNNRCMSPGYDNVLDEDTHGVSTTRSRGRTSYGQERPYTVCGDNRLYSKQKQLPTYDEDDDNDYTPMINVFHLENLDSDPKSRGSSKSLFQPMCLNYSGSEPKLVGENAKLNNYVHIRPYAPSLEFVGRKKISSGTDYSYGHYSPSSSGSTQSRPHSVYTDGSYSGSSNSYSTKKSSTRPLTSYGSVESSFRPFERSSTYKSYSPEILPSNTYSRFNTTSSYRRGPISSAIMRQSRNLSNSISDYNRSYNFLSS